MINTLQVRTNETITQYIRRAREFRLKLEEKEYDIVLQFFNDLLGMTDKNKLTSLIEFKKINHDDLIRDMTRNKNILKNYKEKFAECLDFELCSETIDKMKDENLINIIRELLKKINYKLKKRRNGTYSYYSVRLQ